MQYVSRYLLALQAGLLAVAACTQGAAEPIPIETFFREHYISKYKDLTGWRVYRLYRATPIRSSVVHNEL